MPYVTPKPGTGMLPPLPATNQPGQTKPATQAAQTAPTQTAPNNVGPRDANAVATQQGSSVPSIMLVVEEPLPPALLKKGENSPAHAELNKLLLGIGQIKVLGSGYTESTEAAIKTFQRNNGLRETGEVDEKTLRKLIDACKENDSNYPQLLALLSSGEAEGDDVDVEGVAEAAGVAEPEPVVYANDFERVKAMVANQISEKGGDPEQAFEVGTQLTDHAKKWDRRMPSSTMCYTAVKRAIDDAMNIPYKVYGGKQYPAGGSAKTAGAYMLSKSSEFVKIEGLKRTDLDNLPAGAVIVYKPRKGHGHIGVQDGKGLDISDKARTQRNVHTAAAFEVYFPVSTRP